MSVNMLVDSGSVMLAINEEIKEALGNSYENIKLLFEEEKLLQ